MSLKNTGFFVIEGKNYLGPLHKTWIKHGAGMNSSLYCLQSEKT